MLKFFKSHHQTPLIGIILLSPILTQCDLQSPTSTTKAATVAALSFSGVTSSSNVTCTNAQINWSSVPNAIYYSVFDTTNSTSVFLANTNSSTTNFTIGKLNPGTTYKFRVHVTDSDRNSDDNNQDFTVTTLEASKCAYMGAVIADHPLVYWRMNESAGETVALDYSGNGYHGTYSGDVGLGAPGPFSKDTSTSARFDAGSGIMTMPSTLTISLNSPITIEYWNYVATADNLAGSAFTIGNLNGPARAQSHTPWTGPILYWDYGNIGTTGRITTSYTPYLDNWTHVALVSAGVGGNYKAIYLNGTLITSSASSDGPNVAVSGGYIGGFPLIGARHKGRISDFAVYTSVLTPAQISAHFQAAGN